MSAGILLLLQLVGEIDFQRPTQDLIKKIQDTPNSTLINLYINSNGGNISVATEMGSAMAPKNVHCYVRYAESAALQLVMPGCTKVFTVEDSVLRFHAAHITIDSVSKIFESKNLGEIDFDTLKKVMHHSTNKMANLIKTVYGSDAKCPPGAPPEISSISDSCLAALMNGNMQFTPAGFNKLWAKPKVTILSAKDWKTLVGDR